MEREIRCLSCNRLLLKGRVAQIEIKCPKCGCLQCFLIEGNEMKCYCVKSTGEFTKVKLYGHHKQNAVM